MMVGCAELQVSKRLETRERLVEGLYRQYLQQYEEEQVARNDDDRTSEEEPAPGSPAQMEQDGSEDDAPDSAETPAAAAAEPPAPGAEASQCQPCAPAPESESNAAAAEPEERPSRACKKQVLGDGDHVVSGLDVEKNELDQKCEVCGSDDDPRSILLCDTCDGGYHLYCVRPKLNAVPKGEWHCTRCRKTAQVLTDEPFGFKDGPRYTLPTFHTLAQSYKQRWYREGGEEPPVLSVEQDFWEVVEGGSLQHDVQVLYANDLPTLSYGSGFPSKHSEDAYASHPWNLNVMPTQPGSLLRHLEEVRRGEQLSGITAPWLYFGMLFSSFCWHNEDNYLYSINYMHWGEGKVWYAVPGGATDKIEQAFRDSMPELFASSPDLLFHITTMLSPRILKEAGVPCYKLVQRAGEYVITFPKAYHGGFSLGFNCAEAVNFACADWLPWGQDAISKYRAFKHLAAFSLQKLLCNIADTPPEALVQDGEASLRQVAKALEAEIKGESELRDAVFSAGTVRTPNPCHAWRSVFLGGNSLR